MHAYTVLITNNATEIMQCLHVAFATINDVTFRMFGRYAPFVH